MNKTKPTTWPAAPSALSQNGGAKRPAFSLSPGEGVWAFAVAVGAWYLARYLGTVWPTSNALPAWLSFALCNALGVSALCAGRFVLRVQTRTMSAISYAAFAFPFLQALLIVPGWSANRDVASYCFALFLFSLLAHLAVSVAACIHGCCQKESRGDIAALFFFFVWFILLGTFAQGRSTGFAREEPKAAPSKIEKAAARGGDGEPKR